MIRLLHAKKVEQLLPVGVKPVGWIGKSRVSITLINMGSIVIGELLKGV